MKKYLFLKTPEELGAIFYDINTKQQVLIPLTYFEMLSKYYFENNILLIDTNNKIWLVWIKIPFMFSTQNFIFITKSAFSLSNFANELQVCKKILFSTVQCPQKSLVLHKLYG